MPPGPPWPPICEGFSSSLISETRASVVSIRPAIEDALRSACFVTLAGSMIPAASQRGYALLMMRLRALFCSAVLLVAAGLQASPVEQKLFPLLQLIEQTPPAAAAIVADPGLQKISIKQRWAEAEIGGAADALKRLYASSGAVRAMVDGPLRRGHAYIREEPLDGAALLAAAWTAEANGIDNVIDVYMSGKPPKYAAIDSPAYDVKSEAYTKLLHTVELNLGEEPYTLFFQPSLHYALELLAINGRDEAGRHEPMAAGVNAAAVHRIPTIDWRRYPYTVIVVPGYGPEKPDVALSPQGRERVEIALRRFRTGKAPLLLLSGGYVHPAQTRYCEAIEMKNVLVAEYGVPADAILVDLHARHTTTNLRNAARLMHAYGIPFDRKGLITTDTDQSTYIASDNFAKRCLDELGYQPAKIGTRVSQFDLEFVPQIESMEVNTLEPLDP